MAWIYGRTRLALVRRGFLHNLSGKTHNKVVGCKLAVTEVFDLETTVDSVAEVSTPLVQYVKVGDTINQAVTHRPALPHPLVFRFNGTLPSGKPFKTVVVQVPPPHAMPPAPTISTAEV